MTNTSRVVVIECCKFWIYLREAIYIILKTVTLRTQHFFQSSPLLSEIVNLLRKACNLTFVLMEIRRCKSEKTLIASSRSVCSHLTKSLHLLLRFRQPLFGELDLYVNCAKDIRIATYSLLLCPCLLVISQILNRLRLTFDSGCLLVYYCGIPF